MTTVEAGTVGNRKIFTRDLKALTSRFVGNTENLLAAFSPGPSTQHILSAMTPARSHAHGLASPSLSQLSLTALLCVIAELVHSVAAMLGMRRRGETRDWHTSPAPQALPQATPDTPQQETPISPTGLMLSLSKHEAVLTTSRPAPSSFDTLRIRRSVTQGADTGPPGSRPARAAKQRPLNAPAQVLVTHLPGRSPAVPSD